jgi:hypothetical protein
MAFLSVVDNIALPHTLWVLRNPWPAIFKITAKKGGVRHESILHGGVAVERRERFSSSLEVDLWAIGITFIAYIRLTLQFSRLKAQLSRLGDRIIGPRIAIRVMLLEGSLVRFPTAAGIPSVSPRLQIIYLIQHVNIIRIIHPCWWALWD